LALESFDEECHATYLSKAAFLSRCPNPIELHLAGIAFYRGTAMKTTTRRHRGGFTLVEVLIVVVIMAVLAATVIPQFSDATNDAKVSTATFNLNTLRTQIQFYKAQHNGKSPSATLVELISKTDANGAVGTGATYVYGPYLASIPENPITGKNTVRVAAANPPAAASGETDAGWLYHAASGMVWIDDAKLITE
jgi:prepilin-type N-terminal cleavage/methylation domain-containing protein